jgi:hypothetical protein
MAKSGNLNQTTQIGRRATDYAHAFYPHLKAVNGNSSSVICENLSNFPEDFSCGLFHLDICRPGRWR